MPTKVKGNGVFHEVKLRLITKSLNNEMFELTNILSHFKKNHRSPTQKHLFVFLAKLKYKATKDRKSSRYCHKK